MAFTGMEWIVVIVAVILFLFGAKKIPELARSLGKASGEFNRGKYLVQKEMRMDGLLSETEPASPPILVDEAPPSPVANSLSYMPQRTWASPSRVGQNWS